MENVLNENVCKEVWYVLKKLPLNIISKIPFEIRNNIAKKADKSMINTDTIDTSVNLKDMNITDEAKKVLLTLYMDYLTSDSIKSRIDKYIKFCDNNKGDDN